MKKVLQKQWDLPPEQTPEIENELKEFSPIERAILYRRGIALMDEAIEFIDAKDKPMADPYQLHGMREAVDRVSRTIKREEKIAVYGDYDADGVTATVVLVEALKRGGADVSYYIPDRHIEGYGLNIGSIEALCKKGIKLIITVDCGIRAIKEIEYAHGIGVNVIVTDHHEPGQVLPGNTIIINPKQPADESPFKEYAGVGMAYLLADGFLRDIGQPEPTDLLDLVAIGTVADMVPLIGNNRTLVASGLRNLQNSKRPGLQMLIEEAGYKGRKINAGTIGFIIGPRINAAGRIDRADLAIELLLSKDQVWNRAQAIKLEEINKKRRGLMEETISKARAIIDEDKEITELIFIMDSEFHEGIIGLAAGRLKDEYYRPAVVAARGPKETRASARSIPEFSIIDVIDKCADLLIRYGGHKGAAGFTVSNDNLESLVERLQHLAAKELAGKMLNPHISIDAQVGFLDLSDELLEFFERLEPCGMKNPRPILMTRGVKVLDARVVGAKQQHLKLTLMEGRRVYDAIAFRQGGYINELGSKVDVIYYFEENEYRGIKKKQLNVIDIHAAD